MINPALVDVVLPFESGYSARLQSEDTRDQLCAAVEEAGASVVEFPKHLWIDPKDWADKARENDKNRTWPIDFIDRFTNQGSGNGGYSTHECTSHAFRACFEAAWNRQRHIALGPPVPNKRLDTSATSASVWISCLSVYGRVNPSQWGGANVREILRNAAKYGVLPDKIQPRDYGFKHALQGTCGAGGINQSRGDWVAVRDFPEGCEETSKHFRPLEYCFPEEWEHNVCLVLHGIGVAVGRSGHSVPHMKWLVDEQKMQYPDSYDVFRYDSIGSVKATVGGSYAILSTTTPDDWNLPAGPQ